MKSLYGSITRSAVISLSYVTVMRLPSLSPSMRIAVKPHQAFSLAARTIRAAGLVPIRVRVPAVLPSILSPSSPPRTAPDRVAAALVLWVGGVRLGPGARPGRPSIRGEPAAAPGTLYRIRLRRPARH